MEEPLVSITIPTYNRPDYLKHALASAVGQTYRNTEIIVSDNASHVSAQAVVDSFADPRIRFHRYPQAVSMFGNHIGGFRMAAGKYVASLHDDDIWESDFLEKMVPPLEANPELVMTFCSQWVIDENGAVSHERTEKYNARLGRHKLVRQMYRPFMRVGLGDLAVQPASSAVIRREGIDWSGIPEKVGPAWDVYVSYLLAATGQGAYFIPEKLACYRIHSQSDTGGEENLKSKMQHAFNQMNCYEAIMEHDALRKTLGEEMFEMTEYRWQHACTSMGLGLLKSSQVREARRFLFQSLSRKYMDPRTWAATGISLIPHPFHRIREEILEVMVKAK